MLIKITKSCSNGCSHCLNDSKPCDEHMSLETFHDALVFTSKYDILDTGVILTGGEPTENPLFLDFISMFYSFFGKDVPLTITTNGHWVLEHQQETMDLLFEYPNLFFQITYDSRYYPKKLDITKRILRLNQIIVETNVANIYPQGRAIQNGIPKSNLITVPKCTNLKLLAAQMGDKGLKEMLYQLRLFGKFCTPAIHINGQIGFGESDLCLLQCSIYNDEQTIIEKMLFNECKRCPLELQENIKKVILDGQTKWRREKK